MNNLRHIISGIAIILFYATCMNAITLRVISNDSSEPLPFSIIRIPNKGSLRTDSFGIVKLNMTKTDLKNIFISSFGYETQNVSIPSNLGDTLDVRLSSVPIPLQEMIVKPLKKDKDFIIGRQKHSFGIFNTGYFNIYPQYGVDSLSGRIYETSPGVEFNAARGRMNRLNAFGINILPTDSMIKELIFYLYIYDMAGHVPEDTVSIPNLAHPPITIRYRSDLVDKKEKQFRHVFSDPIDLPDECMIIIDMTWYDDDNISFLEGKRIKVLTKNTCLYYKEGNPYKLAFPPFLTKKMASPFFWELSSYYVQDS